MSAKNTPKVQKKHEEEVEEDEEDDILDQDDIDGDDDDDDDSDIDDGPEDVFWGLKVTPGEEFVSFTEADLHVTGVSF